ncbi:MAG: phosphate ABC transporter permease subunit PstC [Clostridia bacterium]
MKKKLIDKLSTAIFFLCALVSILSVLLICIFLFAGGVPAMGKIGFFDFLFGQVWKPSDLPALYGILPMIVGSLYVTAGAILIGVPIGILTAIFMSHFCQKGIHKFLKPLVELLAGIPSIVYGFFGLMVLVPLIRDQFGGNGNSILTASILLGIMILPTVISISEAALRAVPDMYYEGALALGATHERSVFSVVLPAAKSGVFASIVLGIGRAIGETMAVIMVAGNQARMPVDLLKGVRTLTANIVIEMGYAQGLHREALIATGVVLFVFILLLNISFHLLSNRKQVKG